MKFSRNLEGGTSLSEGFQEKIEKRCGKKHLRKVHHRAPELQGDVLRQENSMETEKFQSRAKTA